MSRIRVTYSGLISFGIGIITIFTGLVFTLIVTRQLSPEELGTWTLIGGLLVYVLVTEPLISYWTTREIARKEESGRTAVFASGFFSIIGMILYLIIVMVVQDTSEADSEVLLLAVILIPVTFIHRTLSAISYGSKPQVVSYGNLVFEITKIPLGLILVYYLQLGVEGAIIASTISHVSSIILLLKYSKEQLRKKFKKQFIKKWIKLFWISLYPGITAFINKTDVLIFTLITGSVVGLAYYTASLAVSSLVKEASGISRAIYPKLLSEDKREVLQENLLQYFYFAFPLTAISLTFMKAGLFALNPLYETATTVVLFLTLRMFVSTLYSILYPAITGIEKVDTNKTSTFRDYFKSKLFLMPTINIVRALTYITSLIIILIVLVNDQSQIDLIISWSVVAFIIEIPFVIFAYRQIKKNFSLNLDKKSLLKYLGSTIVVFSLIKVATDNFLIYRTSIFEFLPDLLFFVLLSVISYFGITFLIDQRTRNLYNAVIKEIKKHNK